ncbi:hypothetical protein [Mesorhizobium erdmanii]|uniref:hypothetical protein n=1 Tax=Mesorhizobium erdmanii TaxID=1777866 RepID=UPI0004102807|nr:hypothetical protein [Mesorhizobium erdmanii]
MWRRSSPIRASGIRGEDGTVLRRISLIGLVIITFFFLVTIFAQWIAPCGLGDIAGSVWEAISAKSLLGTAIFDATCPRA